MASDEVQSGPKRRGTDELKDDLAHQLTLLGDRSPVYRRALTFTRSILEGAGGGASENIVASLERVWRDRVFTAFYDRPLLLLAAMRLDVLVEGTKHPLWRSFGAPVPDPDAVTLEAMLTSLAPSRLSLWLALATRRVQTNDVSRAVAWRWPAHLAGCDNGKKGIALFDIGASAGLNLIGDTLGGSWSDASGAHLPVASRLRCVRRIGFDPHPLDARDPEDVTWLRACIWPGETARLARLDAALRAMIAAQEGEEPKPKIHAVHAGVVPARLDGIARSLPPDVFLLAYQTLTRGYIEVDKQDAYESGMHAWLASLPPGRATWIECEIIKGAPRENPRPAEIVAHVHAGNGAIRALTLGHCGYHPTDVAIDSANADAFTQVVR